MGIYNLDITPIIAIVWVMQWATPRLGRSLNSNTHPEQPSKLSEFFRQSPLVELTEELDLGRDRSLPRDAFTS